MFDLNETLEDFELVARLREARRFPGLVPRQQFTEAELVHALDTVSAAVADGLSLRSGGALAGISHRVLALWIRRADDGAEPFTSWLATLLRDDAVARRQTLIALRELSKCDTSALREIARQAGMPSALERELDLLRRSKTAPADAFFAPVDAARAAAESQSVVRDANTAESLDPGGRPPADPSHGSET